MHKDATLAFKLEGLQVFGLRVVVFQPIMIAGTLLLLSFILALFFAPDRVLDNR